MCYVDEWFDTWLVLDMIWINVVVQHFAYQPPPTTWCIKINTKYWLHAITMSFMWLYAESFYVHTWCRVQPNHPVRLTRPDSRCLLS